MKQFISLYLIISLLNVMNAQGKYDYNWQMGYSSWRPKEPSKNFGFALNFNNNKTKLDTFHRNFDVRTTSVSISDKNGNFIFSSNGCRFYNKNLELMDNGDSLNPSPITDYLCKDRYAIAVDGNILAQGMIALPQADNDSIFYIFHQRANSTSAGFRLLGIADIFYYSVININANNGLGRVLIKNKELVRDTFEGNISATKHANGKDWWLITRKFNSDTLYTVKFTKMGIDILFKQKIGNITGGYDYTGGQSCFTPDGTKFVFYSALNNVMLYDFDRTTGLLSNFRNYEVFKEPYSFGGAAISPNSRFLYIFTSQEVIQFDLKANNIGASMVTVATQNGLADPFLVKMSSGQLAPDCKIYITCPSGVRSFGYIRYPDRKGTDCQVIQGGAKLPFSVAISDGLPNNPNYRLGVTPSYPCDSTIDFRVSTNEALLPKVNFVLFPNPATNELNIDFDPINGETKAEISLYNLLGSKVGQQKLDLINTPLSINVSNLPSGMYNAVLQIKGRSPAVQKFVIIR
jgi:hypothetical protein